MKTQQPNVTNVTLLLFAVFCLWQQSARGLLQLITKSQVLPPLKSNFKSLYFTFNICDFEALLLCLSMSSASGQYLYLSVSWKTQQEVIISTLIFVHSISRCMGRLYIWFFSFWRHRLAISSPEGSPGSWMSFSPLSEAFPWSQREPYLFTELYKNILACFNRNEKSPWEVADGLLKRNEADWLKVLIVIFSSISTW